MKLDFVEVTITDGDQAYELFVAFIVLGLCYYLAASLVVFISQIFNFPLTYYQALICVIGIRISLFILKGCK